MAPTLSAVIHLFCANVETEFIISHGESVQAVLCVMLTGHIGGAVIGKQEFSDDSLFDLCNSFQMVLVM